MGEAFTMRQAPQAVTAPAQVAAYWARAGFPVFPCKADKSPLTPKGFYDATTDPAVVAASWREHPSALVGIATGAASGLFVIDLDTDRETGEAVGEASLAALGYHSLVGKVPTVATPSGGLHLYFRDCGLGISTGKMGRKIDTRGNGGYVIAPGSVTPSGAYVLLNGPVTLDRLTSVPEALIVRLKESDAKKPPPPRDGLHINTGARGGWAETALHNEIGEVMRATVGARNATLNSAAFNLAQIIAGGELDEAATRPQLLRAALAIGLPEWEALATIASAMKAGFKSPRTRPDGGQRKRADEKPSASTDETAGSGKPADEKPTRTKWCADTACTLLETVPEWAGVLAYDELVGLTLLLKPIPGTKRPRTGFTSRPLTDNDITAAVRWFNRNGYPDATKNATADAVYLVAGQNVISPVRHFLEGLSWDGVPRVADWLTRYCGAEASDLTAKVGRAWLVSAVARALNPGCKADCALVLEGKQGAGKSSILRALAGGEWFHDGLRDMHGKDASAALRGKWIIELPELSAMRRSDTEAVKAFLSRTEERYRPAYGRAEVVEPRRCIFAGTTNRNDYLTDDTGGRRFWPVVVGEVKLDDLTHDREQIWAEAVALFRAGVAWWLDGADEGAAAAVVATRAADDPWTADVLRVVEGLLDVSTRDIFQYLDIGIERRGKAESMRIAGILTRAGWAREGKFTGGANRDLARYVAPVEGRP